MEAPAAAPPAMEADVRSIRREIVRLAWPLVLQSLLRTVMFWSDTLMLTPLGDLALAAVALAGPVAHTLGMILTALGTGTLALVARATGAGDAQRQEAEAATSIAVAAILGVVLLAILLPLYPLVAPHLIVVKGSEAATQAGREYLGWYLYAVPFILFDVAAMSVMRASGDTRTPMIFAALAIALNIVGNYALIFGRLGAPRMGVAGAGLATAAAMVVEGTLMTVWLFTGAARLRLKLASFARVTVASVRRLLAVSLPAATEPLLLQIGFLLFIRMMAELGTGQLAAHRVAVTIESISFMPGWGLGIACGAIVGQQLGAKRPDLALTGLRESLRLALFVMVPLGFVFALFAGPLARAMLDDPASARACAWCLRVAAVEQIAMALAMVLSGGLRGAGDTKSSLVGGMLGVWVIRLPLSYVFAFPLGLGIVGAWIVMIVDWCARAGAFALVWRRGKWKSITL